MKLLAWDTSSKTGALAALEWEPHSSVQSQSSQTRLVAEFTLNVDSTHSEQLLWGIHQTLQAARWKLADIDVFGVGLGPGSFTGLRIGITTARTLSHTLGKPLVGISSLAALARPMALHYTQRSSLENVLVVAATDACKGELFALWGNANQVLQCVAPSESGSLWNAGVQEKVVTPEILVNSIQKGLKSRLNKKTKWVVVGEGRRRYLDEWSCLPRSKELEPELPFSHLIQGRYVALLALEAYQAGLANDPLQVHPHYLRASDAELKLRAGLLSTQKVARG